MMLRPNLLIGRDLMFTVPAWILRADLSTITLTVASRGADAGLPIIVSSRLGATEVGAYAAAAAHRMLGLHLEPDSTMTWPVAVPTHSVNSSCAADPERCCCGTPRG